MQQSKLLTLWQRVPDDKSRTLKKTLPTVILLICLGLLAFKTYSSWEALLEFEWKIRYSWLVPSFLLFLVQILVIVWGWCSILNHLTIPIPFPKHVKIYCYTTLARRIPAGLLWQVAGRAYWYRQLNVPASTPVVASFIELQTIILTGLPIGVLQIGAITALRPEYIMILFGLAVAAVAVLIQPNLLNRIRRFFKRETLPINLSRRDSLGRAGIYVSIWLLSGTGLYIIVNLFYDLPPRMLPQIIGVWTLSSLVSYLTMLTPSGFGVKELSLAFLLGLYLPEPLPLVVALAIRALWTVYELITGLASLAL
jgi:uncharacterized membrane protein YbhN (UPF0104 family)